MTQAESSVKSADGRLPPLRQCPNVTVHSQSVRRLPPPYWIGSRLNLSDLLYKTYIKFFLKKAYLQMEEVVDQESPSEENNRGELRTCCLEAGGKEDLFSCTGPLHPLGAMGLWSEEQSQGQLLHFWWEEMHQAHLNSITNWHMTVTKNNSKMCNHFLGSQAESSPW